jgi:hypothetical protein
VVCDEHQDCSDDQRALSIAMHRQGARSGSGINSITTCFTMEPATSAAVA